MNDTKEITVYEQADKHYCEDCKPQGKSSRSTLVVSGYDHCCDGCGEDFKDLAERNEMTTTSYGSMIIPVSEMYQIEIMTSGKFYPMHKWGESDFSYFRKARKQTFFKTERGARKFIEEYATRVDGK